ncbi:hypothetical protein F4811DRAFT_519676 [Daldinia bambusicola]|nr:hypothetical protein F4811DRAFT_519676 [Daldinia bambusicola]
MYFLVVVLAHPTNCLETASDQAYVTESLLARGMTISCYYFFNIPLSTVCVCLSRPGLDAYLTRCGISPGVKMIFGLVTKLIGSITRL